MNIQDPITPEVQALLDTLAEHGANQRRQDELGDLIDHLATQEQAVTSHKRVLWPWLGVAAAAACLALVFIPRIEPAVQQPGIPSPIAVESHTHLVAQASPVMPQTITQQPLHHARHSRHIAHADAERLASTQPLDLLQSLSLAETEEPINELDILPPSKAITPVRLTITGNTLVCYDCNTPRERYSRKNEEGETIFGTPIDPYMECGALMLASL